MLANLAIWYACVIPFFNDSFETNYLRIYVAEFYQLFIKWNIFHRRILLNDSFSVAMRAVATVVATIIAVFSLKLILVCTLLLFIDVYAVVGLNFY